VTTLQQRCVQVKLPCVVLEAMLGAAAEAAMHRKHAESVLHMLNIAGGDSGQQRAIVTLMTKRGGESLLHLACMQSQMMQGGGGGGGIGSMWGGEGKASEARRLVRELLLFYGRGRVLPDVATNVNTNGDSRTSSISSAHSAASAATTVSAVPSLAGLGGAASSGVATDVFSTPAVSKFAMFKGHAMGTVQALRLARTHLTPEHRHPPLDSELGLLRMRIHWGQDHFGYAPVDYAVAAGNRPLAMALRREQGFESRPHESLVEVCSFDEGGGLDYLKCIEENGQQDTDLGMVEHWKEHLTGNRKLAEKKIETRDGKWEVRYT